MNKSFKAWLIAILFCLLFSMATLPFLQLWILYNPYTTAISFVVLSLIGALLAYLYSGWYIFNKKIFVKWVAVKIVLSVLFIICAHTFFTAILHIYSINDLYVFNFNEIKKSYCSRNYIIISFEVSDLTCSFVITGYKFFEYLSIWIPVLLIVEIMAIGIRKFQNIYKSKKLA